MKLTTQRTSPFLQYSATTQEDQLAILHLKRDLLIPTLLRSRDDENEGYDEGKVTNTRFGSFPHSTLIDVPWGSQVRASAVDTGSRGRKGWEGSSKKRKRNECAAVGNGVQHGNQAVVKQEQKQKHADVKEYSAAIEAKSGFVHVLPPTPEIWTASLPHRTQVVYAPDYSYILHRIRARPGTRMIEAGAGSGSFAHAAARAVFKGYPKSQGKGLEEEDARQESRGRVYSFEFHEQRADKFQQEIREHSLDGVVELTRRDVCVEGFVPATSNPSSVKASAVFLDLPAPWLALKHLTREASDSPLDVRATAHLCTFSPCIEQVKQTITTMRQFGWLDIEMVEIAAKRIEVRRERVGLQEEGLRGVTDSPATVDEAVGRLREVEGRSKVYHEDVKGRMAEKPASTANSQVSKQQRWQNSREAQEGRKLYKEGRLITRPEPELKTHTSYLVFAILPRQWTEADEHKAQERWPSKVAPEEQSTGPISKRARKKAAKKGADGNKSVEVKMDEVDKAKCEKDGMDGVT
ncbi:MAG: hypothetical protein Q9217_001510 [Psora testacea]